MLLGRIAVRSPVDRGGSGDREVGRGDSERFQRGRSVVLPPIDMEGAITEGRPRSGPTSISVVDCPAFGVRYGSRYATIMVVDRPVAVPLRLRGGLGQRLTYGEATGGEQRRLVAHYHFSRRLIVNVIRGRSPNYRMTWCPTNTREMPRAVTRCRKTKLRSSYCRSGEAISKGLSQASTVVLAPLMRSAMPLANLSLTGLRRGY